MNLGLVPRLLHFIAIAVLFAGCARSPADLFDRMVATDNNEEFRLLSGQLMESGKDSIPIFLALLARGVPQDRKLSLIELSKDGVCLERLNDLAKKGIFSIHEIPALLQYVEREPLNLQASLLPADTLRLITGLDVGYNEQFVAGYTKDDASNRRQMVAAWRSWYEERRQRY